MNKVAAFLFPLATLVIGVVGISKETVVLWVPVPLIAFYILLTTIAGLVLIV